VAEALGEGAMSEGIISNEMAEGLCFSVWTVHAHPGNIFNARYAGLIFGIRGEST
jgi:hypothetical protein